YSRPCTTSSSISPGTPGRSCTSPSCVWIGISASSRICKGRSAARPDGRRERRAAALDRIAAPLPPRCGRRSLTLRSPGRRPMVVFQRRTDWSGMSSQRRTALAVLGLATLGLVLRFHGLGWGLPFVYEEAYPFKRSWDMWGWGDGRFDLNPHFFNYPTLY